MRIAADRNRCSGNGVCESVTGEYFELDDDGVLALPKEHVDDGDDEDVSRAVRSCPAGALSLQPDDPQ